MIFEASFEKGKTKKAPTKLKSKSFSEATSFDSATHIKLMGLDKFVQISQETEIKKVIFDGGRIVSEERVHYSQIAPEEGAKFFYVTKEGENTVETEIDTTLYTQIVVMKKSEKGNYYRCSDGKYVRDDEIQIPAYKKVETYGKVKLDGPVNDGQFYVEQYVAKLKSNGEEIVLTKAMMDEGKVIKRDGGKIYYLGKGGAQECEIIKNENTRCYVDHVLIGDQIVETSHLSKVGDKIVVDITGLGKVEGEKHVKLANPFIDIDTIDYPDTKKMVKKVVKPAVVNDVEIDLDIRDERVFDNGKKESRVYRFSEKDAKDKDNIREVKDEKSYVVITYWDGHRDIYVKDRTRISRNLDREITKLTAGGTIINLYQAEFLEYPDLIDGKVKYSFKDIQKLNTTGKHSIIEDTVVEEVIEEVEAEVDYYPAGDRQIQNIKWTVVDGKDQIAAYEMNGVKFSNITWDEGEIKSCEIEYIDEDGELVTETTSNIKNSLFKNLAIKYSHVDKLENVKINDDATISFKLGNYEFRNSVIGEDGKIGKCELKIGDGEFKKVDLATEPRFEQLRLSINTILVDQDIVPLVQSALYEKKDGKYQLVADVVQTRPLLTLEEFGRLSVEEKAEYCNMTKDQFESLSDVERARVVSQSLGTSPAKTVKNMQQALEEQEKFKNAPFKTVVFDPKDPSKKHILTDFENKYESASEFELDKDLIPNYIGRDKIDIKNGKVVIDPKNETDRVLNTAAFAFGVCGYLFPLGLAVALPLLPIAATMAIVAPIRRAIKAYRLEHLDIDKVTQKMQKKAEKRCYKNINKHEKEYRKTLRQYKKMYSSVEYEQKAKELKDDYDFKCRKEIGKVQILGQGAINCKFNLAGKTKLTKDNTLGFIAAKTKQREIERGAKKITRAIGEDLKSKFCLDDTEIEQYKDKKLNPVQIAKNEYKRQKSRRHIEQELADYNAEQEKQNKPKIDEKDFKKILKRRRNETIAAYGSTKDKLKMFKQTADYKLAKRKDRRKLLEDKRKALGKAALVGVEQVQFNEQFDKNGRPVAENVEKDVLAYIDYTTDRLNENSNDKKQRHRKCVKDFHSQKYAPEVENKTIAENTSSILYSQKERRCEYDRNIGKEELKQVELSRQQVAQRVSRLSASINAATGYEQLTILEVEAKKQSAEVKRANVGVLHQIRGVRYAELNDVEVQAKEEEVRQTIISTVKVQKQLERRKEEQSEVYRRQVEQWARADYIRDHKEEFIEFAKNSALETTDDCIRLFVRHMEIRHGKKAVADEMTVYKVKNHVEENIRAEVFCDKEKAQYEAWVADYNRTHLVPIDSTSAIARSRYYVERSRQDVKKAEQFKQNSKEECQQKAQERANDGVLDTSREKDKNLQDMQNGITESLEKLKKKREKDREKEREKERLRNMSKKERMEELRSSGKYEEYRARKAEVRAAQPAPAPAPTREVGLAR